MISLRYLRENNAKLRKNKRRLAIKIHPSADFRFFVPPAQESATSNAKAGRDRTNTAPPTRFSIRSLFEHRGIIIIDTARSQKIPHSPVKSVRYSPEYQNTMYRQ